MTDIDDQLAQYARLAMETAAEDLGVEPLALARRLNQGEIARLIHLLNAAFRHVDSPGLRHRIEDLLLSLTEGRMPGESPETELDWALKVVGRRREEESQRDTSGEEPEE